MGKNTDKWRKIPVTVTTPPKRVHELYEHSKKKSRESKEGYFWKKTIGGKTYFFMGSFDDLNVRLYRADEIRDAGYHVVIVNNYTIWARKGR